MDSPNMPLPGAIRNADWHQAAALIALGTLPTMAIAALVAVLPTFDATFAQAPHRALLVPMILTAPSLCVALLSAPIGLLADRWGRRPVLLLSLVAFTVFGALPMLFDDLYAVVGSRFIVGIGEAGILSVGNALMGDYFNEERRKYWLGIQMSVGPFVASAYILLGGMLASWNWHGPFLIYLLGAPVLITAVLLLFEPARTLAAKTSTDSAPFPWRATWQVCLVTLFVSVIFFLQAAQHGRIFDELGVKSPARNSLIITLASAGTVVGGYCFKVWRPFRVGHMLALALACYGVAYLGISLSTGIETGLPLDAIGQFAGGYVLPTLIAWALTKYRFEQRGRGMGFWAAAFFLGQFLNPPVMQLIAHGRLNFMQSTGVLGALCLVAAVVAAVAGRNGAVLGKH